MAGPATLTIHTDGASRGNPGPAAYAYVIERDGSEPIEEAGHLGQVTNNQAEYTALVRALEHALQVGPDCRVVLKSDSELMVKQMRGEYRVKNEDLRPLYEKACRLADQFPAGVTFHHVRREQNSRADALCNEVLDGKRLSSVPLAPRADKAPGVQPAASGGSRPRGKQDLHEEALAYLTHVVAGYPPEEVWDEIVTLLGRHGVRVPGRS